MKNSKIQFIYTIVFFLIIGCNSTNNNSLQDYHSEYVKYGRLTDPGENEYMLQSLPNDINEMSEIANVQGVHITMLSQWKIPRTEWKLAHANHDIKDILDTLKVKGSGKLTKDRKLEDRVLGACTKESIFSAAMLKSKGIPARIRVGYLTNLYTGDKAIEFWRNVNKYGNPNPSDSAAFDQFTLYMKKVNKAIEHWVTEYWDVNSKTWKVLDIRPEYLQSYGLDVNYHLPDMYFEFGHEAWMARNDSAFLNDAYSEGELDGKSHIRYQMLLDFYSLLNHDVPGLFDDEGKYISNNENNDELKFLKKNYDGLSQVEINELDSLAVLLNNEPNINELLEFYSTSKTLKINSMFEDRYSFVFKDQQKKAANNK